MVDAEWQILYDKLDKLAKSGTQVVLSKLPIGDVATQYFADRSVNYYLFNSHHICGSFENWAWFSHKEDNLCQTFACYCKIYFIKTT